MFRPSQALLFRPMPTLNRFILHPPLPLNPRESKQLLNLLSSSFRKTLDKEHGFRPDPEVEAATERTARHNVGPRERRRSHSDLDQRPTDRHIRSILSNPLFSLSPASQDDSKVGRDPMEVFNQAVAKGMMNIRYARACLEAKKREIIRSPVLSVREGMRESGAGLKVLRWLVSSGIANNNDFLRDLHFAAIFMEYVVAEELQEAAWKWIKRAFEDYPVLSKLSIPERKIACLYMVRPLMCLIKAEATGPASLDAAYMCLSRAAGYLKGLPANEMVRLLGAPGRFLSHETIMSHATFYNAPHHSPASESAYDSFIALVPVIAIRKFDYHLAHLTLLHPTRPNADPALAYLKKLEPSETEYATPLVKSSSPHERRVIQLGLDAAKFLLERERFNDAQWVMQYLRTHYSRHLEFAQREQLEQAKAEASSLQLLEELSLA
jgi:hypothetical protein